MSEFFAGESYAGATMSPDYAVEVNGCRIPVYATRVSKIPYNCRQAGEERFLDQTEIAAYTTFDFTGQVEVTVTVLSKPIEKLTIRPKEYGIEPKIDRNKVTFTLDRPRQFSVEVNGFHHALHIFANEMETFDEYRDQPDVIYFGAGRHEVGRLTLTSHQTLVLDHGAVLSGSVRAENAEDIRIIGRGTIDCSGYLRPDLVPEEKRGHWPAGCIQLFCCRHVVVDGIILHDANTWTANVRRCENVLFHNVKLIGMWRYSSDGIDLCNSRNCAVRHSFLRTFDDGVVFKGLCYNGTGGNDRLYMNEDNVSDCEVSDCVFWCDWGRAFEIGVESYCRSIGDIVCRDCHVIHATHVAYDIFIGHRALVHDIHIENVSMEIDDDQLPVTMQIPDGRGYDGKPGEGHPALFVACIFEWSPQPYGERGNIRNVSLKHVRVYGKNQPAIEIRGYDETHTVENVTIDRMFYNGELCRTAEEMELHCNRFTKNIRLL